ncbi:MAG: hypothetical protein AB4206_01480 [Xenococcaceae cyanobacterium]
MRRRTSTKNHIEVELFPFLSILACTIGTLILLIIVLTTQALEQQEVTIVAKTENGENRSKSPRYIECRQNGVVLYPSEEFVSQEQLDDPNSALRKLIAQVKANKDKEYLIVALRPNGIDIFERVRSLVEGAGIDIGYEPVDSTWKLIIQEEAEVKTQ